VETETFRSMDDKADTAILMCLYSDGLAAVEGGRGREGGRAGGRDGGPQQQQQQRPHQQQQQQPRAPRVGLNDVFEETFVSGGDWAALGETRRVVMPYLFSG